MKFLQANALSFVCLAAMTAIGAFMYPSLPETLPTQYSFDGVAGNYLPKQAVVLMMPLAFAFSIIVVNFMIHYSPEKFAMPNSQRAMDIIVLSAGILLLSSHVGILVSQGDSEIFQQYFAVGFAGFLIIMGNVMGKTERNFIAGIRIPWTIASEQNWRATHRMAGRLMVISGLLVLVIGYYYPSLGLTLILGLSWAILAIIYSFVFYLKNERAS